MKSVYLPIVVAFGSSTVYSAPSSTAAWVAPGPNDVRAPCPMLNTLANHGFLPHDGKGITVNKTISALGTALNIDQPLSEELFNFALTTNPTPNSTYFDLDHLSRHNILEHDGSLSRQDSYFGPADVFNEAVFNQTKSYWTGDTITIQMAANARVARLMTSNLTNPEYSLSDLGSAFSIGETAAYIGILGDKKSGTVPKSWVEYLFVNERLPYDLGFAKPKETFVADDLSDMMVEIVDAQHFPQSPGKVSKRSAARCPFH
ncbi:Cloroperoxidase [Annulohypoxylon maeteangense]|uniref:Cloroperoxidase n=1 Tax=Annulohypoxylon maeteangense TaxID=1927788 RepID=UPI002007B478|nr:Cloroperoxidase [Annulohypoxylon maeteangense]KAI0881357.1 Cloroperoxidase [Annulohypoxylon maeteangense]